MRTGTKDECLCISWPLRVINDAPMTETNLDASAAITGCHGDSQMKDAPLP